MGGRKNSQYAVPAPSITLDSSSNLAMILGPTNPNELQVKPQCGVRNLGQPSPQSQPVVLTENSHQFQQSDSQCNTADCVTPAVLGQEHSNPQVDPSALPNHTEGDNDNCGITSSHLHLFTRILVVRLG